MDGKASPPSDNGPYNTVLGKCSLRYRDWHLNGVKILSIFSRSFLVLLMAIRWYMTPGSNIDVIAVHFAYCESLLCFSLPMYEAAISWH